MSLEAPPRTIHYPLSVMAVRRLKARRMPGDLTAEESLELDDTDPDDSRFYAVMVACGWIALAVGFLIAMALSFPVRWLLGAQAGSGVATACLVGGFFCLAGGTNVMARMLWYVPQARRRLRNQGAGSKAFKKSMRRTLPRNTSLLFQSAIAILVLVLAL